MFFFSTSTFVHVVRSGFCPYLSRSIYLRFIWPGWCISVYVFDCPRRHVGALEFIFLFVQVGAFRVMFLFVHVSALEFMFLFVQVCDRAYAFICPRQFMLDLLDQVDAFGFRFLLVHVRALEFIVHWLHPTAETPVQKPFSKGGGRPGEVREKQKNLPG